MPSKKRRISSSSGSVGSPSDQTRNESPSRSAQAIATTRCRYNGRKSLPVAARRCWNAQVMTSSSERSADKRCKRRRPATSGTVSMSKASVGVMRSIAWPASRSAGKHAGRQVAIAAITDDEHDRGVLDLARDAQRNRACAAGGYAGEDALHARELARGFLGVGLRHRFGTVDAFRVVNPGQICGRPLADSRNLRALLGLATDDDDVRILL